MNRYTTKGIVLSRTDFGEADRILTFLTPDKGKVRAIAKGVRRAKSKLAGGIELFCVSDLTLIKGRSEIDTLISARLDTHFGKLVTDYPRSQAGYEVLKTIKQSTDDQPESIYFELTKAALAALHDQWHISRVMAWFYGQLLKLEGHTPNLQTDKLGHPLDADSRYLFDFGQMGFDIHPEGIFTSDHIKLLRLGLADSPMQIGRVEAPESLLQSSADLLRRVHQTVRP